MNEHISERIPRGTSKRQQHQQRDHLQRSDYSRIALALLPPKLNRRVREYFVADNASTSSSDRSWLAYPEVPTSDEFAALQTPTNSSEQSAAPVVNRPFGPWRSRDTYLSAHYALLRESAVRPLREACAALRDFPTATEDAFDGKYGLYDRVRISEIVLATRGLALKITFSIARIGRRVLWEQSKRLITGSMVLLTPCSDMFASQVPIVATVASRYSADVDKTPPEIHLYIADWHSIDIDSRKEYFMVESRSSYFEGDRHTLLALQHMSKERFPLAKYLVEATPDVSLCGALADALSIDVSAVFGLGTEQVDLRSWKGEQQSVMDPSQLEALSRMLTKELAIVQGPPGTGKTFVAVQAIRIMLANRKPNAPPILLIAQTNHAVDQIARHVLEFEPDLVRLGGMSKDKSVQNRTLHEVRKEFSSGRLPGSQFGSAENQMRILSDELAQLLVPLTPSTVPLDVDLLEKMGILSHEQVQSLLHGAVDWKHRESSLGQLSPMEAWLAEELIPVPKNRPIEHFDFPFEEADLDDDELMENEQESGLQTRDAYDQLVAKKSISICDNFTGRRLLGSYFPSARELLKKQDMYAIDEPYRGAVYCYLQQQVKDKVQARFRVKAKEYDQEAVKRKIGGWEMDETVLKEQKVIAMTTTGFSKYRGLLCSLNPSIILCDEAAEVLEAPVAVACVPSLQQLILVGDHLQLRPHVQSKEFEDEPYFLNLSLFERLVNNNVEFSTLKVQRRMTPEIRRNLTPIYGELITDHISVLDPKNRPSVRGMGGVNSFWFTHQWPECRNARMSSFNPKETEMIVGFVVYLLHNGYELSQITCLTFYNGQREALLRQMDLNHTCRDHATRQKARLQEINRRLPHKDRSDVRIFRRDLYKVVTVDSYQGEENDIVILSLTRSNTDGNIGFLANQNRACVSLSRARCGFYIFGNGMLLHSASDLWAKVAVIMSGRNDTKDTPKHVPHRLDTCFPIRCQKHNNQTEIREPEDWNDIIGGCTEKCDERLRCGHACEFTCHSFGHELVKCSRCPPEILSPAPDPNLARTPSARWAEVSSDSSEWNSFAAMEPVRLEELSITQTTSSTSEESVRAPELSHSPRKTSTIIDRSGNKRIVEEHRMQRRSPNEEDLIELSLLD